MKFEHEQAQERLKQEREQLEQAQERLDKEEWGHLIEDPIRNTPDQLEQEQEQIEKLREARNAASNG